MKNKHHTGAQPPIGMMSVFAIKMAEPPEISRHLLWTRAQMSINDKKIRSSTLFYNLYNYLHVHNIKKGGEMLTIEQFRGNSYNSVDKSVITVYY